MISTSISKYIVKNEVGLMADMTSFCYWTYICGKWWPQWSIINCYKLSYKLSFTQSTWFFGHRKVYGYGLRFRVSKKFAKFHIY